MNSFNLTAATKAETLEVLTTELTAFGNWTEFKAAMTAGYVPTIRTEKLRRNASTERKTINAAKEALAVMVRDEGFRTFGNC